MPQSTGRYEVSFETSKLRRLGVVHASGILSRLLPLFSPRLTIENLVLSSSRWFPLPPALPLALAFGFARSESIRTSRASLSSSYSYS